MGSYTIDKVIFANVVKLRLPTSMRIHLVVNISWIVQYRDQIKEQKKEKVKPVEIEEVKEQEVENFLNKTKVREIVKYLV